MLSVKPYMAQISAMLGATSEQVGPVKCRGQSHLMGWSGGRVSQDGRDPGKEGFAVRLSPNTRSVKTLRLFTCIRGWGAGDRDCRP